MKASTMKSLLWIRNRALHAMNVRTQARVGRVDRDAVDGGATSLVCAAR